MFKRAILSGADKEKIALKPGATHSGENVEFSKALVTEAKRIVSVRGR